MRSEGMTSRYLPKKHCSLGKRGASDRKLLPFQSTEAVYRNLGGYSPSHKTAEVRFLWQASPCGVSG